MWPLIWTNLNLLHTRILCTKFGWIWLSGSGKEDLVNVFSLFHYHIPLAWPFVWTNLNSVYEKNSLRQVWLKSASWYWQRRWKCKKFTDRRQAIKKAQFKGRGGHSNFLNRQKFAWRALDITLRWQVDRLKTLNKCKF